MKNRSAALLAVWFALWNLTAPLTAAAQGAPATPPPAKQSTPPKQELPALRVSTHLVQVNVIVEDKKGEPVTGLTRDDFNLYEQKKPQKIEYFSMESTGPLAASTPPALLPNFYSNRLDLKAGVPTSVTVILLDTLNTHYADVPFAKVQILKFLSQIQAQDRVALYALGARLRVLHDFTSDAVPLLRALNLYQSGPPAQLQASQPEGFISAGPDVPAAFDQMMAESRERLANLAIAFRVEWTTLALEAIANRLAQLPGRKNLIWVTSSFPYSINMDRVTMTPSDTLEKRNFTDQIERAVRALNHANLAVYPVDARGLVPPRLIRPEEFHATTSGPTLNARLADPTLAAGPDRPNLDTMNAMAERTGGRAAYNDNEISAAIRRAIDDSRVTYVLGFYPAQSELDSKFHNIKVEVKRPNSRVSYRKGYFALPEQTLSSQQREALLREATVGPLEATGLGLMVHAVPADNQGGTRAVSVTLKVERREISFAQKEGLWLGSIDVVFAGRSAQGEVLSAVGKTYEMRFPQQAFDSVEKTGLIVNRRLPVPDNVVEIRVVLRDNTTGSIGSVNIPISKLFPKTGS